MERKSFCIFVFVVFFGGKLFILDFESKIISFFFERICKYMCFFNEKEVDMKN